MPLLNPSSGPITQVEVDFGALSERSGTFTIIDAGVTPASVIVAVQAGDAPTGKSADENEMDTLVCRCTPGAGQFTLYVESATGFVFGKFKINYVF